MDPGDLSTGENVQRIRRGVEEREWRMLVIDSLNGLMNSINEENALTVQPHELLSYLNQIGAAWFLVLALYGLPGISMTLPADVGYQADNVLLLRYSEAGSEVRQAIFSGEAAFPAARAFDSRITDEQRQVEYRRPADEVHRVLTGTPEYTGGQTRL